MNITPNYLKCILESVTKEQYKYVMNDIENNSNTKYSPKDIKNVRNSMTYKQIFGNKQRIWTKFNMISDSSNTEISDYYNFSTKEASNYVYIIENYYYTINFLYILNYTLMYLISNTNFIDKLNKTNDTNTYIYNEMNKIIEMDNSSSPYTSGGAGIPNVRYIKDWLSNNIAFFNIVNNKLGQIKNTRITTFIEKIKRDYNKVLKLSNNNEKINNYIIRIFRINTDVFTYLDEILKKTTIKRH